MPPLNFAPATAPNISYGNVAQDMGQGIATVLSGVQKQKMEQQKLAMQQALQDSEASRNNAEAANYNAEGTARTLQNTSDASDAAAVWAQAVREAGQLKQPGLVSAVMPPGTSYRGAKDVLENVRHYSDRAMQERNSGQEHTFAARERRIGQIDALINSPNGMMIDPETKRQLLNEKNHLYEMNYGTQYPSGVVPEPAPKPAEPEGPGLISRGLSAIGHGASALWHSIPSGVDGQAATPPAASNPVSRAPIAPNNDMAAKAEALHKRYPSLAPDVIKSMVLNGAK